MCDRDIDQQIARLQAALQAAEAVGSDAHVRLALLARMGHEIRTPLSVLIGYPDILKETDLDEEQLEFIDYIQKASHMLLDLINELFDLLKISIRELEIYTEPFDLHRMLARQFEHFAHIAPPHAQVVATLAPDIPVNFLGDERRVIQVLTIVVENALHNIKYRTDPEVVTLTVRSTPAPAPVGPPDNMPAVLIADYQALPDTPWHLLHVTVHDAGPIINANDLDNVRHFTPHMELHRRLRGAEAARMFLAMELVRTMYGQLWVEDDESGTSVHIHLLLPEIP